MKKMLLSMAMAAVVGSAVAAESDNSAADAVQNNLNIVWTFACGILVFVMQAGFAMVETGMTRAKNAANIMMKNLMDFSAGSIGFWLVGSALMFGVSKFGGLIGASGWCMDVFNDGSSWNWTFMIFQTMFAATAATIVSGGVAERIEFKSYLLYSILISVFIYPVSGHWCWGGLFGDESAGWLGKMGFHDFAGSTVVHSVGGWLALAGAIMLGPRIGKFHTDGKPNPIPGHNLVLATLGVFLLWIGWFGFNPGSYTAAIGDVSRVAMTTNLGACGGTCAALVTAWIVIGKPDLSMALNGSLAGLVAITAPCDIVTPGAALLIGIVAGVLVVLSVMFFDRIHVDDPVGAVSVHMVNGVWGTIACGLFAAEKTLGITDPALAGVDKVEDIVNTGLFYGGGFHTTLVQLTGIVTVGAWAFGTGLLMFYILKKLGILRVSQKTELQGLDLAEHGEDAYDSFQFFSNK